MYKICTLSCNVTCFLWEFILWDHSGIYRNILFGILHDYIGNESNRKWLVRYKEILILIFIETFLTEIELQWQAKGLKHHLILFHPYFGRTARTHEKVCQLFIQILIFSHIPFQLIVSQITITCCFCIGFIITKLVKYPLFDCFHLIIPILIQR